MLWLLVYLLYGVFQFTEEQDYDNHGVFNYLFPPLLSGRGLLIVLLWAYKNEVVQRVCARSHASEANIDKPLESDQDNAQHEHDFIAQIRLLLMYTTAACIRTRNDSREPEQPTLGGSTVEGADFIQRTVGVRAGVQGVHAL